MYVLSQIGYKWNWYTYLDENIMIDLANHFIIIYCQPWYIKFNSHILKVILDNVRAIYVVHKCVHIFSRLF